MSLLRLLKSGKSLVNLKDPASAYRMRYKNALPRFGSSRNPFARTSSPAATHTPVQPHVSGTGEKTAAKLTETELAAANLKETVRLPVVAPAIPPTPVDKPPPRIGLVQNLAQIARKLNPLTWRLHPQPAKRPGGQRLSAGVVQGELSLDKVKVVRNDLNDADLDVVPAKTSVQPKAVPPADPAQPAAPADQSQLELAESRGRF